MIFRVTEFKNVNNFSFVWCRDVMTSSHDVTKPDLPISACRCARKLLLFLFPWILGPLSSQMLLNFHLCDVVTSCHDVTESNLSISACRCARKLLLFLFPWFFRSLSSKFYWFSICAWCSSIMTSCFDVTKFFHLSQYVDLLERWSCSWFHGFSGCFILKMLVIMYLWDGISCHNGTSWRHVNT